MEYKFNAEKTAKAIIEWIKVWFAANGPESSAVIGISGGKDSTVVAKLCVEALGKDRVIGVLLPNGEQHDLDTAKEVVKYLDIPYIEANIKIIYENFVSKLGESLSHHVSNQTLINLTPRIRMTYLRGIAQSSNGRLINTSNLSEDWVGYATVDGDAAGDMSPLAMLTVQEVKAIGHYLEIPTEFVEKVPEDGLVGMSDEENLGVKYADIDTYIRKGEGNEEVIEAINKKFETNKFKLVATIGMPKFYPEIDMLFEGDVDREWALTLGMAKDPRLV